MGLGLMVAKEGERAGEGERRRERHAEAVELFRNALAAAPLSEGTDGNNYERMILKHLIESLFVLEDYAEVEPLVARFQEASREEARQIGQLSVNELIALILSARLHEVLCLALPHSG